MPETKKEEKEQNPSTTKSSKVEQKASAEKSAMKEHMPAPLDEPATLVTPAPVTKASDVLNTTPKSETKTEPEVATKTFLPPAQEIRLEAPKESTDETKSEVESTDGSRRTVWAFGSGILIGALVMSFLL